MPLFTANPHQFSVTQADTSSAINEAAEAAKKAKDATVLARSKSHAEALMSGNGELMTSVLSTCFSDPKYGIRKTEEVQIYESNRSVEDNYLKKEQGENERVTEKKDSTYAYIYLDGDVFIRLNLTAPYWGTASAFQSIPTPLSKPEGKSDAVDWAIFILILASTAFGFLVMAHQIGLVIDKRLRFRHIFHPTSPDDESEEQSPLSGKGFPHSTLRMQVESIPASMLSSLYRDQPEASSSASPVNGGVDIEMAQTLHSRNESDYSIQFDVVERPSLKTASKIALPSVSPIEKERKVLSFCHLPFDVEPPRDEHSDTEPS